MLYKAGLLHTLGLPPQPWAAICLPKAIPHCQVNHEVVLLLACYLLSGFLACHQLTLQL